MQIFWIYLDKKDFFKFVFFFVGFLLIIFYIDKSFSGRTHTTFDSASIYNKEDVYSWSDLSKLYFSWEILGQNYFTWSSEKNSNSQTKSEKKWIIFDFYPKNITIRKEELQLIKKIVLSDYLQEKTTPLEVVLDYDTKEPRGRLSNYKLSLALNSIKNNWELAKVLVHELWHVVDIYYLDKLGDYDLSDNFYEISWLDSDKKKSNSKIWDFASWYALSNKYEDFAESFTFYVFHNDEFKKRSEINYTLKKKYIFFSNYIFVNDEFKNTAFEDFKVKDYNRDTTKISINLTRFLYYLE